jgi:hypothetical protein
MCYPHIKVSFVPGHILCDVIQSLNVARGESMILLFVYLNNKNQDMNKIFFMAIYVLFTQALSAQLNGKPKPKELPTPHFTAIKPADLEVSSIRFVSVSVDPASKMTEVHVEVSIVNNGQATAAASKLKAFIQDIRTSPSGWVGFGDMVNVPAITGAQTYTAAFVFRGNSNTTASFNFRVNADAYNAVTESNETNNQSASIRINSH